MSPTNRPMKVTLDANCFIEAVNPHGHAHASMKKILKAREQGKVELTVSLQTLHELERKIDAALGLARTCTVLPHSGIGTWDEQVGTWEQEEGTWDDGKQDDKRQHELERAAKAGTNIRDRGAYIDALRARMDAFVTSDKQLAGRGPAPRIESRLGLRVVTPEQLAADLRVR